ncbi:MAG: glycosyl hydrolase [bacterium]
MGLKENFRDVGLPGRGMEFRGVPFWSWNDDLDPEELKRQIREMKRAGLGGHFMHARIGLVTPYMGEEWMKCTKESVAESLREGISPWLYDEKGWPSGTAGGYVTSLDDRYRQRSLKMRRVKAGDFRPTPEETVAIFHVLLPTKFRRISSRQGIRALDGDAEVLHFYCEKSEYVDVMCAEAISRFIESTHQKYYDSLTEEERKAVPGIFTDEPQCGMLPWSVDLPRYFEERNGYDIVENLPALFYDIKGSAKVRYDYWRTVTEMFVRSYSQQIGEWCSSHGWQYTGHYMAEDSLASQLVIGAAMPHYEYMHVPGIDHLGRGTRDPLLVKQVSSVAHQLGGRRVISEMFGISGWNVSFEELKWIAEWQFVLGVDLVCQHLSLYSMRGCRKRDYPPSLHYQQPYWEDYHILNDYFTRLLFMLTRGKHTADILVLHPMSNAWLTYRPGDTKLTESLSEDFSQLLSYLSAIHRDYDLGDEIILERYGKVEGEKLRVGECAYSLVIVPHCYSLSSSVFRLLKEFSANDGLILPVGDPPTMVGGERSQEIVDFFDSIPSVPFDRDSIEAEIDRWLLPDVVIVDERGENCGDIYYQRRDAGEVQVYFLANTSIEVRHRARVKLKGRGKVERYDPLSGDVSTLPVDEEDGYMCANLDFHPGTSHLLVLDRTQPPERKRPRTALEPIYLALGRWWEIEPLDLNALTLDRARYRIDGGEWNTPKPVIKIQREIVEMCRDVDVELEYTFYVDFDPDPNGEWYLVMELPGEHTIRFNDTDLKYEDAGWWRDISFRRVPIGGRIRRGENKIYMRRRFTIDPDIARKILDGTIHESVLNVLSFPVEFESVYILGDFAVTSNERPVERKDAIGYSGDFFLRPPSRTLEGGELVTSGYPFYSGSIILRQKVSIDGDALKSGRPIFIDLGRPNAIVAKVRVNGEEAGVVLWAPYSAEATRFLREGENEVEVVLTNSNRNLLGPHHHIDGELGRVGPGSFSGRKTWCDRPDAPEDTWTDTYWFVPFGLAL